MTVIKQQEAKPHAGGGSAPQVMIRTAPLVSPMAGRSLAMVAVSTSVIMVFVPLYGLIWTLNSSKGKPTNLSRTDGLETSVA